MKKITFIISLFLCLSMAQAQTNLLAGMNSNFEAGNTSSWRYVNVISGGVNNLTATMSTTDVHGGNYAAQVAWSAGSTPGLQDEMFDQNVPVTPGQKLIYKAWAKSLSGTFVLRMHCTFFGPGSVVLLDIAEDGWVLTGNYTEHTWILPEAPNGTIGINIGVRAFGWDGANFARFPATEASCLIDDVRLIEQPVTYSTDLLSSMNGDLEKGNLNDWRYLPIGDPAATAQCSGVISTDAHGGTSAAQITWATGLAEMVFDQYPLAVPGQQLVYKAWAKAVSGPPFMLRMHCTYFDGANNVVGDYNDQTWIPTGTYTEHTWVVPVVPAGTVTTNIGFRAYNADGGRWPEANVSCLIDDVRLLVKQPAEQINVMPGNNGGFELGNTTNWRYIKIDPAWNDLTAPISTSDVHSGAYAAEIAWPAAYSGLAESLLDVFQPAIPGELYTFKAWAKLVSGPPFMLRMHCTFYGNAGFVGDYNDQTWIVSSASYSEHVWTIPAAPSGTVNINIGFRAFNADGSRWPQADVVSLMDDVQLLRAIAYDVPSISTGIEKPNTVKCSIYPNPASGVIDIMSDKAIKSASIYNMAGQKVKEMNSSFTSINISDLHSGIYFVKMLTIDGEATQKLVVK